MFSKKNLKVNNGFVEWTPPKRHDGKNSYIDFSMKDPVTGSLKRKKIMLDKYAPGIERDTMAAQIISNIFHKMQKGWNCWDSVSNENNDKPFLTVIEEYRAYINYMCSRGAKSDKTMYDYGSKLKALKSFIETRMPRNMMSYQFDIACATSFLDYILMERKTSTRNRNNYRTWLSAFTTWLVEKQYLKRNFIADIPSLPEKKKFRQAIPAEYLKQMKSYLEKHDKRFLLACMMEYYCFIRPTELVKIKIGDISIKNQTVFISAAISKNRHDGVVALNDRIIKLMIDLQIFTHPNEHYIFGKGFAPSTEPLHTNYIRIRFSQMREALGWPMDYQFYSLKDSGIRDLANSQGIVVAKEQARHSDISVTNHYLEWRDRKVNEDTKHFDGLL
jgi:integrase